jgi:hypothetical protein
MAATIEATDAAVAAAADATDSDEVEVDASQTNDVTMVKLLRKNLTRSWAALARVTKYWAFFVPGNRE